MNTKQDIENFAVRYGKIRDEIGKEMVGQENVVEHLLLAVVAGGNVLLEGVPGLGKTHLVRTLSKVLDLSFSRIQFTPDLMPADVTGTNIFVKTEAGGEFRFQPGPLFASIVLADEINRATPKTQSALLEAMQEQAVTQNPVDFVGTYPLPEAQLDRFLFKVIVPFPTLEELSGIVDRTVKDQGSRAEKIAGGGEILALRDVARQVPIAPSVQEAALRLVLATHPETADAPEITKKYVRFGASPRGAQALPATARVRALNQGRFNVAFDDLRFVAPACLRHRMALNFEALTDGVDTERVIAELMIRVLPG